ncbi:MAG: hypothetical protein IJ066_01975 [Bacteroidaceae bacterium]|nr:hypothetical protein [Bacteroidaceae bacterium]
MLTKGGILMCIINVFFNFVSNGAKTLHDAALGIYTHESDDVKEIREELFGQEMSDAEHVRQDWRMIARDARVAIDKLKVAHE